MTITTRPPSARTNGGPANPAQEPLSTQDNTRLVRRAGVAVAVGAATWAASLATVGNMPTSDPGIMISDLTGLVFQLGLFVLVTAQLRTRATGTSRAAVGLLKVEYGLLSLAAIWSVLHGLVPAFRDDLWLAILDVFWPLSMRGMAVIGVKILFTRRWRGLARIWPAIAETWALVTIPSMGIFGQTAGRWIGVGHLVVGYLVLGLILALRPSLAADRD